MKRCFAIDASARHMPCHVLTLRDIIYFHAILRHYMKSYAAVIFFTHVAIVTLFGAPAPPCHMTDYDIHIGVL
jgi:hypothetical protein